MSAMRILGLAFASLLASAAAVHAAGPFHTPTKGNQYVTKTGKYLYVVWSVPRDLSPFAGISGRLELEAFIARTAIHLCTEHHQVEPDPAKPCKVQVVRMKTNDEYTKSAAGGFETIAQLVLPRSAATKAGLDEALASELPKIKALFTRFEVKHERISGPGAK